MEQAQASRRLLELLRAAPTVRSIRSPYVTKTVRQHQVAKATSVEKAVGFKYAGKPARGGDVATNRDVAGERQVGGDADSRTGLDRRGACGGRSTRQSENTMSVRKTSITSRGRNSPVPKARSRQRSTRDTMIRRARLPRTHLNQHRIRTPRGVEDRPGDATGP